MYFQELVNGCGSSGSKQLTCLEYQLAVKESTRLGKVQGFESWRPFLSQPLLPNGGCDHRPARNNDDDNRAGSPLLLGGIQDREELAELTYTQKVVRGTQLPTLSFQTRLTVSRMVITTQVNTYRKINLFDY